MPPSPPVQLSLCPGTCVCPCLPPVQQGGTVGALGENLARDPHRACPRSCHPRSLLLAPHRTLLL